MLSIDVAAQMEKFQVIENKGKNIFQDE